MPRFPLFASPLALATSLLLLTGIASSPLQPAPALALDAIPAYPPATSKPVYFRIGSVRYRLVASVIRTYPGIIPDPTILPPPGPTESITFTLTQIGSRSAPTIRSAVADITFLGRTTTVLLTPSDATNGVQTFSASPLPSDAIPAVDSLVQTPPVAARLRLNTSRGNRSAFIREVPITVIPLP